MREGIEGERERDRMNLFRGLVAKKDFFSLQSLMGMFLKSGPATKATK